MRRGINRPEIETLLCAAVMRLTGFTSDRVFFSEYAVDTAGCPRPCVSMRLMPYETEQIHGTVSRLPSLEYWRLVVTSSADGPKTATIDGVVYPFTALGNSAPEIRDGLLASINLGAHPHFTAISAGTASIDVESQDLGRMLAISVSAGLTAARLRADMLKTVSRATELRLEIECVGTRASPPDVALTGVDIAERLQYALLDVDETYELRDAEHHITRVRTTDERRVESGREETIGKIDAVLGTSSLHVGTRVGSARSAAVTFMEGP